MNHFNFLNQYFFFIILLNTLNAIEVPKTMMSQNSRLLLEKYCLECHDSDTEKGNINLENISSDLGSDIQMAERWQEVLNVINSGDMPPEDKSQFHPAEKTEFLSELSKTLVTARKIHADNGGVITLRRLNRREYSNTIEELLGVRPVTEDLPSDLTGDGFDTTGASLFFSSGQFEKYIEIAYQSLTSALFTLDHSNKNYRQQSEKIINRSLFQKRINSYREPANRARSYFEKPNQSLKDFGFKLLRQAKSALKDEELWIPAFEKYLSYPEVSDGVLLMSWRKFGQTTIPIFSNKGARLGDTKIRVRVAKFSEQTPRYHYLEFIAKNNQDRSKRVLGWRKVSATMENPEIIEFTIPEALLGVTETYCVRARSRGDKGHHTVYYPKVDSPAGLWVDWCEVEYSKVSEETNAIVKEIFFTREPEWDDTTYAREVITRFATRAFRTTKPSQSHIDKLVAQYKHKRAKGESLKKAIVHALSLVLASPSFLYLVEPNEQTKLSDPELAVRLSYFLWSSPPDQELLSLANSGTLSNPKVFEQQVDRMLKDPKVDRFIHDFGHQWLDMDRLGMFKFSSILYPDFDIAVLENARTEIYKTLRHNLDHELELKNLLSSDYVIVNDIMADYYGLKNVKGHEFRKVTLPEKSIRGGLLSTAAVLAMGSDGKRTSPVERGAWVMRHLLNDPPPPAPPNVPQLSKIENQIQPARALQKIHQAEPQCAQCHRKIDPIGLAMENFNAVGKWRDQEVVGELKNKYFITNKQFPIQINYTLWNGNKVHHFNELKKSVATETDHFARGLVESLIAYGIGRPYGFTDHDLANHILKQTKPKGYRIKSLIHALVQTPSFQNK